MVYLGLIYRCWGSYRLFKGPDYTDRRETRITFTPPRCAVCLVPLPESYYEDEGQPYCMEHFYEESAHRCGKCDDYITGPTMVRIAILRPFT